MHTIGGGGGLLLKFIGHESKLVFSPKIVDFGVLTGFRRACSYVTGTYRNVLVSNVNI